MSDNMPILDTGAAGNVGSVGRGVVKLLREHDLPVRALVHKLDERSQVLSKMGAELVVADLTNGADVVRALRGCSYYSSSSKRNHRFRDFREYLANDSFADESN
jgi:uncharacterized protein YbjT (DUF2867 family)